MDALAYAARTIRSGKADVVLAGGVESMSRAPFVLPKADPFDRRQATAYDTTIGWRFVNANATLKAMYGTDSMQRPPRTSPPRTQYRRRTRTR